MTCSGKYAKGRFFVLSVLTPFLAFVSSIFFAIAVYPAISKRLWPSTDYYELQAVVVMESALLENYRVLATRVIKKEFDGGYEVVIRRLGDSKPVCTATKDLRYVPRADGKITTADFSFEDWTATDSGIPCIVAVKKDVLEFGPASYTMTSCIHVREGVIVHMEAVCALTVFAYPATKERPA